jgi:hypothetical protein
MWHRVGLVRTDVSEERGTQHVPPKRFVLRDLHGATSQKAAFCYSHRCENVKTRRLKGVSDEFNLLLQQMPEERALRRPGRTCSLTLCPGWTGRGKGRLRNRVFLKQCLQHSLISIGGNFKLVLK